MRKHQFDTYVVTRFIRGTLNEPVPACPEYIEGNVIEGLSDYSVRFHKQGLNHA